MKDQVFVEFEKWFKNKEIDWNKEGIFIKEIHYEIKKDIITELELSRKTD